ncbi:MAG: phosphoribosyltransferase, partial [Phycisphaerae bacterium]|nr:phosphoribosyltransferase [Phycisphaerae bacterium]
LIALRRNVPVTDVDGYLADRPRRARSRGAGPRQVLLVDDSVTTGLRCEATRTQIAPTVQRCGDRVTTLAVYGVPQARGGCDVTLEDIPLPRLFEWNFMRHAILADACMDIDGVLCRDPKDDEDDDAERYGHFLKHAEPQIIPSIEVGWLVSCRLEKYRAQTEDWLRRHGVRYRHLVLMDLPTKQARIQAACYGRFKAETCLRVGGRLFIESNSAHAVEIAELTGVPVLCTDNHTLFHRTNPAEANRASPSLV